MWARYELFMCLDMAFNEKCIVNHSVPIWKDSDEEADIIIEPHDAALSPVAIKLRCERVSENCGSYETFRDQMDSDMARIKALGSFDGFFEGIVLRLVGFSGEPSYEDHEFRIQPQPKHFQVGEVHVWVAEHNLTPDLTEPSRDSKTLESEGCEHDVRHESLSEHESQIKHGQSDLPIR